MWKYEELLRGRPERLESLHSAAMNLACAHGLPGTEQWNPHECFVRIDEMTEQVRWKTMRAASKFQQRPQDFLHSDAYFRAFVLTDTLQRHCGVCYNPAKVAETAPLDAWDTFVYGAVLGGGGTCASLPVVYASVGQRLGYPMKLVAAKTERWTHLFVRWEGMGERFNIETTASGFISDPDDHYRTAPYAVSRDDESSGQFLQSMTPRQEMGCYLMSRAHCHQDLIQHRGASHALAWACALCPENLFYTNTLKMQLNDWLRAVEPRIPTGFPQLRFLVPTRRYPNTLPLEFERHILDLEAKENLMNEPELEQKWWAPLRNGNTPPQMPHETLVDFAADGGCQIHFRFQKPFHYSMDCGRMS